LHWNGLAAIDLSKAAEQGFLGKTPPMAGRTGTTITLRQGKYRQGFLAAKPSVEKICVKCRKWADGMAAPPKPPQSLRCDVFATTVPF
ncbi:MAG: hypothetical protein ACKVUS_18475, partial [Saprospiraceae bacterium]